VSTARLIVPLLIAGLLWTAGAAAGPRTASGAVVYSRGTPMILHSVTLADLKENTHGVCTAGFTFVIKNAAGPNNAVNFLDAAQRCNLKVIYHFGDTVDESTGTVYPSRVPYWVDLVKAHPALWGYLSVKEPSWTGVSGSEIQSLYRAFKAADPKHPVLALFGDIPHFGESVNPYTAGMADVVMVDWYPVETTNGSDTIYLSDGPKWFAKVKSVVEAKTPGRPTWLEVQTFKYLGTPTHKKQRPSQSLLWRQVRDGFNYLKASGIAFQVWKNTAYDTDQLRDRQMFTWMKTLKSEVRAGTFQ